MHSQPIRSTVRSAIADTGAQLNIVDVDTVRSMGMDVDTLIPSTTVIKAVSAGSRLDIAGVIFLQVTTPGPPQVTARVPQQFHVARNKKTMYLSHRCL